jgi:hypothetical protein
LALPRARVRHERRRLAQQIVHRAVHLLLIADPLACRAERRRNRIDAAREELRIGRERRLLANQLDLLLDALELRLDERQRAIADFLDAETTRIDNLVSALGRKLDLLAERRSTGVAYHVVNGDAAERRPSTLPWVATIPTHWEEPRLGLVARMGSGHTPSRSRPEWWVDCTIPWVTTGEVVNNPSEVR